MDDDMTPSPEPRPFWTSGRIVLAGGALALVFAVSAVGYVVWRSRESSPQDALVGIASATIEGDADAVAASLDTTALVDSAVDEVFSGDLEQRALIAAYLGKHPNETKQAVKGKARALLDEEIREHVEAGTLPKRIPLGSESLKVLAAKAYARGSIRSVKVVGDVAHVVVTVPYKGKTLRVNLRMKRVGGKWKIDKIENLSSVLKQAGY